MKETSSHQSSEQFRIVKIAGIGLYILFVCNLLSSILPLRLIEPAWQLSSIAALQNFAFLPLIGTCVLLLGLNLDVGATGQRQVQVWIRRASGFACFGFLLLIPLQASAMWRLGNLVDIPAERMIGTIAAARSEIASSQNLSELNTALLKLPGAPKLPPGFNQPLAKVRQSLLTKLGDDLAKLRDRQTQLVAGRRVTELLFFAKTIIVDLVFALFFGAVAGFSAPRLPAWLIVANPFTWIAKRIEDWERQPSSKRRSGWRSGPPGPAQVVLKAIKKKLKFLKRQGDARKLAAKSKASRSSRRS